ncbi:MAG: ABC transporter ATP-binding protein [Chloroflexota bacterium]
MTFIVRTQALTKRFGNFTAVSDLNLTVQAGDIYGFLGPNGAGKTTTLLMLLGLESPTSGNIQLFGAASNRQSPAIKRRIGVSLEHLSFYDEMTAIEYLLFFARLYEVREADRRAQYLLERLQLQDWKNGIIGSFSTGMQRKLALARTLLHEPELLILDEPISGLDPFSIVQVRELLLEANRSGTTILISSHQLSEVERTADKIGIIADGKLVTEDTVTNLRQRIQPAHSQVTVELAEVPDGLPALLREQPFAHTVTRRDNALTITTNSATDARLDISKFLADKGVLIVEMQATTSTLEDAFITLTASHIDHLRDDAEDQHTSPEEA